VVTTPMTWASTGNMILAVGARPVFVDVDSGTLNIDPEAVARAISPRTRALLPVHFAGQPVDLDRFRAIAADHGLALIEDPARASAGVRRGPHAHRCLVPGSPRAAPRGRHAGARVLPRATRLALARGPPPARSAPGRAGPGDGRPPRREHRGRPALQGSPPP